MNRVFWSIIEARGVKAGPIPEGLWPLLEDDLPVSPDLVFAVGAPLDRDRLLVCAALKSEIAAKAGTSDALIPSRLPELVNSPLDLASIDLASVDLAKFNVLVGPYEPQAKRAARHKRRLRIPAAVLLCSLLIAVGLERRGRVWKQEADRYGSSVASVLAPLSTSLGWDQDDMVMELRQRRQAVPVTLKAASDASLSIAAILDQWPIQIPAKTQGMLASGDSASVSILVPGDPAAFIAALKPPEGWKLEEPRLVSVDQATRITLELRRALP